MFICYIYRHLCFDDVYMPIKNLKKLELELVAIHEIALFHMCDRRRTDTEYWLITHMYNINMCFIGLSSEDRRIFMHIYLRCPML